MALYWSDPPPKPGHDPHYQLAGLPSPLAEVLIVLAYVGVVVMVLWHLAEIVWRWS